jgi:hypothetical protein
MIDWSFPSNPTFAVKLIKEICTRYSCLDINTFKIIDGIDYTKSLYSKPSDLLFGGGILSDICLDRIKIKPVGISVLTKKNDLIEIYFDKFEGYLIVTEYETREYKTIRNLENQLEWAIRIIYFN